MRILLFAQSSFFVTPQAELAWLRLYAKSLERQGLSVRFFDLLTDKVREFDWIHVFSREEPETWRSLADAGARIVVTPSLDPAPPRARGVRQRAGGAVASVARALLQRRWPPVEESRFHAASSHFFVASEAWAAFVRAEWRASPASVSLLGDDPAKAAREAAGFFRSEKHA